MKLDIRLDSNIIKTIARRKSVFLDTNVWINISDQTTTQSCRVEKLLKKLCQHEVIFCPLAYPTIEELTKQSGESLPRTIHLMEELSLNVTFNSYDDIFDKEMYSFVNYLRYGVLQPLRTQEIFGPLWSFIRGKTQLSNYKDFSKFDINKIENKIRNLTVNDLVKLLCSDTKQEYFENPEYQNTSIEARKIINGNIDLLRRIEHEEIARKIIIPKFREIIKNLPLEDQIITTAKLGKFEKDKKFNSIIKSVLRYFPAVSAYVDILTIYGYDTNRKDKINDFFDREFLIYGTSYASVFCAIDKGIKNIINLSKKERYNFRANAYLATLDELEEFLLREKESMIPLN